MGQSRDIDIKRNFTILDNSIYDQVLDNNIKLIDVVIYAAIKTQNDGNYGRSISDISRLYHIPNTTVERCVGRLSSAGIVSVSYLNGKATCVSKCFSSGTFDKIPKTLLMSEKISLQQKAFLISVWNDILDGYLHFSKASLHKTVFKELHQGVVWVSARVNELCEINLLTVDKRLMKINFGMVVDMSDTVISNILTDSSNLENVVVEYEEKTGIARDKVFEWSSDEGETIKPKVKPPKWLNTIVDAIADGCKILNKNEFNFSSAEYSGIGKNVKEIIDARDGDGEDRILQRIIDSIIWKANNAQRNIQEKRFYTQGFFARKVKNNIASNLYHYDRYVEENPYAVKPSKEKKVEKVVKKNVNDSFEEFDYGFVD